MNINLEILNHFCIVLLPIIFNYNNIFFCIAQNESIDNSCSNSFNNIFKNDEYQSYIGIKKSKMYDQLHDIIEDIVAKRKANNFRNKISFKITKKSCVKSTEIKQNVDLYTSVINEDRTVPLVTQSPSQSNSASSHFNDESIININDIKVASESNPNKTSSFQTNEFAHDVEKSLNNEEQSNMTSETVSNFEIGTNETGSGISQSISSSQEDIPSFREWTEKHLAEEEKERGDENITNISINGKGPKIRNKNYASLDCGAKILSTNLEATSAGSMLSSSRDEYLLSPCNSKIWFVVELCEAVQLKKVELANFELFSSSPKEFSILISDRFPSRDWSLVGQFIAKDEKSVQSFNLQPHHFTKYIKVEFHSHYGREHFCPVSLFRVYGTSELDVLETVDGNEELENDGTENDDVNNPIISDEENKDKKIESTNNLFGSARDAVLNIVKKAAEVLVITPSQHGKSVNSVNVTNDNLVLFHSDKQCTTPRYMIVCQNCKEEFFHRLYQLISCYFEDLDLMSRNDLIWKPLIKYKVCLWFGISSFYLREYSFSSLNKSGINDLYPIKLFRDDILAALCNLIAISENKAKLNVTYYDTNKKFDNSSLTDLLNHTSFLVPEEIITLNSQTVSFKIVESTISSVPSSESHLLSSQIKPTKTLTPDSEIPILEFDPAFSVVAPNNIQNFENATESEPSKSSNIDDNEVSKYSEPNADLSDDSMSLDSLISELEKSEQSNSASAQTAAPKPILQKESVFVRLANRIKALERNMSLSGQYLEELSRRYKKQVEEMQRILSESAEDRQKSVEREAKRSEEIRILTSHIEELTRLVNALSVERDSWSSKAMMMGEHGLIIFFEIIMFICVVCLCRGIPSVEITKRKFSLEWRQNRLASVRDTKASIVRRQSFNDLNSRKMPNHKRRPSEEALKIDGSTHQDLLIYDTNRTSKNESRRKRRKRKELLLKSTTNAINLETGTTLVPRKTNMNQILNVPLSRSASASEIDEHSWGRYDRNVNFTDEKPTVNIPDENVYPFFIKTAVSVRNKRLSNQLNGKSVLSPVHDVSSDQDSSVPSTPIKEKKVNGIKKIVKKFKF